MLVLSRKLGEKIWLTGDIWVTVVDIDRGKIRLGFEAPEGITILRQELLPMNESERVLMGVSDAKSRSEGSPRSTT